MWHVANIKATLGIISRGVHRLKLAKTTYTVTEVVNCLLDCNLTEFLPGPLADSLVLKSDRTMKELDEENVKFWLDAVAALT